jgi:hypothetical protein
MEPRMVRMRGVRAPTVEPRTPRTPYKGCAAGYAVGGASLAPPAHRWPPPGGGGWSATSGKPQQRRRTQPSPPSLLGLSRYPTRTPPAAPGHLDTHTRRPAGRNGPPTGRADGHQGRCPPTLEPTRPSGVPPRRLDGGSPLVVPPRGASRPHNPRPTGPPRGSGAAAPGGALRAIDPSARPRLGPALAGAAFGGISCLTWLPPRVSDGRPSWMM